MRVLDLGSGGNPDIRSTDCVDYLSKPKIEKLTNDVAQIFYDHIVYPGKKKSAEQVIKTDIESRINRMRHKYNINYIDKLPYLENTFDLIISHNSLTGDNPTGFKAYQNAYHVLKHGGRIELTHANPFLTQQTAIPLKKAGFTNIHISKGFPRNIFFIILKQKGLIAPPTQKNLNVSIITGVKP